MKGARSEGTHLNRARTKGAGRILNKVIVKTYYRQHSGFFLFVFLVFFGVVQPSTQLYFHYTLIRGMLEVPAFMALVGMAWVCYGWKMRGFVMEVLTSPDALFLYVLNARPRRRIYRHCGMVMILLYLPVVSYALIIAAVAVYSHKPFHALGVLVYVFMLLLLATAHLQRLLRYPGYRKAGPALAIRRRSVPYWSILLRYLFAENKGVLMGLKGFGCGMLYFLLRGQTPDDYDTRMPFLAFSLALFGHGILLYRCRQLETTKLLCYRGLPVPLVRRFGHYSLFCFLLLAPETLVLGWLTPHPIQVVDSLSFLFSGYSLLLLLNSILLTVSLTASDYWKLCLVLFGILYCCVLGKFLIASSGFCVFMAAVLFFRGYARNEIR